MLAKARVAFDLVCPGCECALRMRADREGKRYATCKTPACRYYEREFEIPTGDLITKLLNEHLEKNT